MIHLVIGSYYIRDIESSNFSNDEKFEITVNSLVDELEDLSVTYNEMSPYAQSKISDYYDSTTNTFFGFDLQIDASTVKERYKSIWGENLTENKEISPCPAFIYDDTNKLYYYNNTCGGMSPGTVYFYINKYEIIEDYLYAYVNIGFKSPIENSSNWAIFDKQISSKIEEISEGSNYEINSSNYTKFSEYKLGL